MTLTKTLSVSTPSELEIAVEREFDAPVDLVFDCYTKPELVRRWLSGPDDWSLAVCEIDLRVGGKYRYVWAGPEEQRMGMDGLFHEIKSPEALVATERFDDDFGMGKMLSSIAFLAEGNRTRMRQSILFESQAQRDAAVETGMTDGMGMSFSALDALLSELGPF